MGNIDTLTVDGRTFAAAGDWGEVRITGTQPRFEVSG